MTRGTLAERSHSFIGERTVKKMQYVNPYTVTAPPRFQQQQYMYNPGQTVVDTTPLAQPNSFNWVQGLEAVKSYPMAPGTKMAFFDSERPRVYIKATDVTGKPLALEIYDLVKYEPNDEEAPKIDTSSFLTEEKALEIIPGLVKAEIEKAMSEISLKPTSKKKKGDDD